MATERQIAANRRNAGKSTGPRSRAGKQRARGNAGVEFIDENGGGPGVLLRKSGKEKPRK